MIPSVFISSTIADLHYVRETARKVVKDFAMNPVMSDFGEIAYMGGNSAESSCYLSVRDCKIMVLIIGRRYGSLSKGNPKVSVTEGEFDEAQEHKPFLITLVERDVINFKDVFDKNKSKEVEFPGMDFPEKTFAFIDKVKSANRDNGVFQFSNAEEVDRILRLQFAGLLGRLLDEKYRPERESIKDILSEVKGIGAALSAANESQKTKIDNITSGARFLLDERNAWFAKLLNKLADLEVLVSTVKNAKSFADLIKRLHYELTVVELGLQDFDKRIIPSKYIKYEAEANPDWLRMPKSGEKIQLLEIGWVSPKKFELNGIAYGVCEDRFQRMKDRIYGVMNEL